MTLASALLNVQDGYTKALHVAGSLAFGAVALIVVALIVVTVTFRWAVGPGGPRLRHPRRGTSALLLGAIAIVLLVASSQHRISSLTIVSHSGTRTMTPARRPSGPPAHGARTTRGLRTTPSLGTIPSRW